MRFTCTINMNNTAFEDSDELSGLLHSIAESVEGCQQNEYDESPIYDSNGNRVGKWEITD